MGKILVVDDEQDIRDILDLILTDEGYEVIKAEDGKDCIEKAGKNQPDLIIMDIRMPGLDGWETIKKLNDDKLLHKSKIIMLTVEKGPGVEIFGLQDHISDYITKPFERETLIESVKKALG